jgi:hypothetical protein
MKWWSVRSKAVADARATSPDAHRFDGPDESAVSTARTGDFYVRQLRDWKGSAVI